MKSFVIGCLVLTSIISICFGEENEASREQKCVEEEKATSVRFDTCMKDTDKIEDILDQLNNTIYNDLTEASLEHCTTRICSVFQKAIDCQTSAFDVVAPECRNRQGFYRIQIQLNLVKEGRNYFCKNNAQHAKDIAENEGYQCLLFTDHFEPCKAMINKEPMFIEKPGEIELNPNFCISLDETKKCVENASKQCKNEKLKTMADELFTTLKAALPCGTH